MIYDPKDIFVLSKAALVITIIIIFNNTTLAQEKNNWFLESAIRFTGDAEMYFTGPSWSAGIGKQVAQQWTVSTAYTYFGRTKALPGQPNETYKTNTIDLLVNYNFLNLFKSNKGWYVGAGAAWQMRDEHYLIDNANAYENNHKEYFTPVYNIGYRFPVALHGKPRSVSIDVKATGSYREDNSIETLTQLMVGCRFRY